MEKPPLVARAVLVAAAEQMQLAAPVAQVLQDKEMLAARAAGLARVLGLEAAEAAALGQLEVMVLAQLEQVAPAAQD